MNDISWWTICVFLVDLVIRLGLSARVIMRRLPVGVSLAWLFIVLVFPFAGAVTYLFIGEARLGRFRALRAAQLRKPFHRWMAQIERKEPIDWSNCPAAEAIARMCESGMHIPPLPGNQLTLLCDYETTLQSLVNDIDAAQQTCHLEFYIWHPGGSTEEVVAALIRAAARDVTCRVLLDDVGSREFLRSAHTPRLRSAGVMVLAALRAQLWRVFFVRFDLRLHRKIVVIDGRIAYTGSLNLADPRYFKQNLGIGEWVDAMVRVQGPAVEPLAITFLGDWALESRESTETLRQTAGIHRDVPQGTAPVQVIPSGPAHGVGVIEDILIATIYSAQRRLILTTPYFVPDESLLKALTSAARRGVDVTLIMPAKVDLKLAQWAEQASQGDLLAAGVRVLLFEGGLLHTKSVSVDGAFSLFGSLNMDPRSLHLNFEITLAIYDSAFTGALEGLQQTYAARSRTLSPENWRSRPRIDRFLENAARLVGPLL
jgi:cardiolipin synthase